MDAIKESLICHSLKKRSKNRKYTREEAERYVLPDDAGSEYNNSYYFSAHDLSGMSLFCRLGQRGGKSADEVWFAFADKKNRYNLKQQLFENDIPLKVRCLEPGSAWQVEFTGFLEDAKTKKNVEAAFSGIFRSDEPIFDFSYDMDPRPMAKTIAKAKWTKAFFKELSENNQTHYEQGGRLEGTFTISGVKKKISAPCIRDHSFGKRSWDYMNMHMWLAALDENGKTINFSMVSYPALDEIWVGNTNIAGGNHKSVIGHEMRTDIRNNNLGQNTVKAIVETADKEKYVITAERTDVFDYVFDGGKYHLYEGLGNFTINGKPARGIIEFGFNDDESRWRK